MLKPHIFNITGSLLNILARSWYHLVYLDKPFEPIFGFFQHLSRVSGVWEVGFNCIVSKLWVIEKNWKKVHISSVSAGGSRFRIPGYCETCYCQPATAKHAYHENKLNLQLAQFTTSRERPKSALYPRLKKCKIFKICSWHFFMKKSQKSFTQRKPSVLVKRFRSLDIAAGTNASTCFRTSASSSVKRNILRK